MLRKLIVRNLDLYYVCCYIPVKILFVMQLLSAQGKLPFYKVKCFKNRLRKDNYFSLKNSKLSKLLLTRVVKTDFEYILSKNKKYPFFLSKSQRMHLVLQFL